MQESKENDLIPGNTSGFQTNTESSVECDTTDQARKFFLSVKEKLLQIDNWHQFAGSATASFTLTDEKGEEVLRTPNEGDHFKIDIPGPGPVTGDGYDWVQIEEIKETESKDEESICIKVRPATNPLNEHKDIAHFFSDDATSFFIVKRNGTKITAGVYGRNEKPNTDAETIIDKARNATIATGATSGLAKLQWKSLVDGLLKP